jgi:hypothetical protein
MGVQPLYAKVTQQVMERILGSDSRCLVIYVGEGAVEAMDIVHKYCYVPVSRDLGKQRN